MGKILIVDDEPLVREMLEIILTRAGHQVMMAGDGGEALKVLDEYQAELIIADIVMPEMDGLETLLQIKRRSPDLDVIAISGGARIGNADYLQMAEKLGATRTFAKPLDNEALLRAIDDCLIKSKAR